MAKDKNEIERLKTFYLYDNEKRRLQYDFWIKLIQTLIQSLEKVLISICSRIPWLILGYGPWQYKEFFINYHPLKQVVCSMLAKLIKSVNTIYNHILKNSIHPCLYFFSSAECTLGSMKSS